MFREADQVTDGVVDDLPVLSSAIPVMASVTPVAQPAVESSRYGERRAANVPAILLIVLVHIVLIVLLVQARQHIRRVQETRLAVVNLLPPPPPPATDAPPPPSQPETVAPPPLVQVPVPPAPTVLTVPDPMLVTPAPAPVVAPVPAAVPPVVPATANIVQGGDIGMQMVSGKPPRYPIESRRKREQGTVVLTLTLGIDGAVDSIAVTRSSGFSRLDNAARDAVRGWRWKPMIQDGQAVRVRGVVEIPFVLRVD